MSQYVFDPIKVAAGLLRRARLSRESGQSGHALSCSPGSESGDLVVTVALGEDAYLFRLEMSGPDPWSPARVLRSVFGESDLTNFDLETSPVDPLWESVDGICSHMEADHADTFVTFLDMVGRVAPDGVALTMPWVQAEGFFIGVGPEPVFIPFPKPCTEPDHVRSSMIKMLRGARAQG